MKMQFVSKVTVIAAISAALFGGVVMSAHASVTKYPQHGTCIQVPARATSIVKINLNLNASDIILASPFSPTDSSSFNFVGASQIYDSLGTVNSLKIYFVKQTSMEMWSAYVYVNNTEVGSGVLTFNTMGQLVSVTGLDELYWTPTSGATSPQVFSIDMTCSTQYAGRDILREPMWQDGQSGSTNFHAVLNAK